MENAKIARKVHTALDPDPTYDPEFAQKVAVATFGPEVVAKPPLLPQIEPELTAKEQREQREPEFDARYVENAPGGIDGVLLKIDAIEERAARYRYATGRAKKLDVPGVQVSTKITPAVVLEIDRVARLRRETRSTTVRFLVECGLALVEERKIRYDRKMMEHIAEVAMPMIAGGRSIAEVAKEIEPQRYIDAAAEVLTPLNNEPPKYVKPKPIGGW
jgi:hypothetical protein